MKSSRQYFLQALFIIITLPTVAGELYVSGEAANSTSKVTGIKQSILLSRGIVWAVIKRTRRTVTITFGPDQPQVHFWKLHRLRKPKYRINAEIFESAFVPFNKWPEARREITASICNTFDNLEIDDCERLVHGEVWPGISKAAAEFALKGRIHNIRGPDDTTTDIEVWDISAISSELVVAALTRKPRGYWAWLLLTRSQADRPHDWEKGTPQEQRDHLYRQVIIMELQFQNGILISIKEFETLIRPNNDQTVS
jgi:hypothetical protein